MKRLALIALALAGCPVVPTTGVEYACQSTADCNPSSESCVAHVCVAASPADRGAPDGGGLDAGLKDAGASDGGDGGAEGLDAGPKDAGASDGGTEDAGSPGLVILGLAVGVHESCAIVDGGVQCWGLNGAGQLGNGETAVNASTPGWVLGLSNVQAVSVGGAYACAVEDGGALCWGANDHGQLGDGTGATSNIPVLVAIGTQFTALAVAAGSDYACAVVEGSGTGGVQCWGDDSVGQLGNADGGASGTPVAVEGSAGSAVAVAAGRDHTCELDSAGSVWCWGNNGLGQLGPNASSLFSSATPISVPLAPATAIAAGDDHTCALVSGGVQCWGDDSSNQLGNDGGQNGAPVWVETLGPDAGVQAIAAGRAHTCAVAAGAVWCWGDNSYGQLGTTQVSGSSVPVLVSTLPGAATEVAAGFSHTCALVGGAVWCWGDDSYGELGNGDAGATDVPPTAVGPWAK
ncbi:MAG: RCC1 domain-containing protein [Deltaproteobacteria bacterium]